ncbi:MAG: sugar phosphate isomerase/epimerase [Armatimonadetes bacterium]|nr:sugar phosphate isomerase/epimerase [Armatimonadota bacterium]
MRIVFFSKFLKELDVDGLVAAGERVGLEGWDLCVRPGYAVNPENVMSALPPAAKRMKEAGQPVAFVTGNFDVLWPDGPGSELLLQGMDAADVRLLKLGYYMVDPTGQDYWREVDRFRKGLEGWEKLGRKYNVKITYHTHSGHGYLGINCAALMHILSGFDPRYIGAYIDPGHMLIDGEPFPFGLAMAKQYLSIVALKDFRPHFQPGAEEGGIHWECVLAGQGGVPWGTVFKELVRSGFDGPCSVHAEFEIPKHAPHLFLEMAKADVAYFKMKRDAALAEK